MTTWFVTAAALVYGLGGPAVILYAILWYPRDPAGGTWGSDWSPFTRSLRD